MSRIRSSLLWTVPERRMDAAEIESMKRAAWLDLGLVVVRPAQLGSVWLEQGVTNWANAAYGPRREGARR